MHQRVRERDVMAPSDESMDHGPCCAASRAGSPQDDELSAVGPRSTEVTSGKSATPEMVRVEGGEFLMGTEDPDGFAADGEGPVRAVTLKPFWIDAYVVTNSRFATFVEATGYITDAERFGWSFVFGGLLLDDFEPTRGAAQAPWWRQVFGASWRHPEGPHSSIEDRMDHPVVHVSWSDAASKLLSQKRSFSEHFVKHPKSPEFEHRLVFQNPSQNQSTKT